MKKKTLVFLNGHNLSGANNLISDVVSYSSSYRKNLLQDLYLYGEGYAKEKYKYTDPRKIVVPSVVRNFSLKDNLYKGKYMDTWENYRVFSEKDTGKLIEFQKKFKSSLFSALNKNNVVFVDSDSFSPSTRNFEFNVASDYEEKSGVTVEKYFVKVSASRNSKIRRGINKKFRYMYIGPAEVLDVHKRDLESYKDPLKNSGKAEYHVLKLKFDNENSVVRKEAKSNVINYMELKNNSRLDERKNLRLMHFLFLKMWEDCWEEKEFGLEDLVYNHNKLAEKNERKMGLRV